MTTVTNPVLPIPEDTIQGSGSYTVPANKYGFLSANTSFAAAGWVGSGSTDYQNATRNMGSSLGSSDPFAISASASANNSTAWLKEGDLINSTSLTSTGATNSSSSAYIGFYTEGYNAIRVNGNDFCVSRAAGGYMKAASNGFTWTGVRATGRAGWSIALYPIPKNNLPLHLIEGN